MRRFFVRTEPLQFKCAPLHVSYVTSKTSWHYLPIRHASNRSKSSSKYLARQRHDEFVRLKKADGTGYVSRSAYKLQQLSQKYPFLQPGRAIVDLGAAPGGWSQAVVRQCPNSQVYALDLLPLQISEPNVVFLRGDFMNQQVRSDLTSLVSRKVDVVLSDMMANTSGNAVRDAQASLDLCTAAFDFCLSMLQESSTVYKNPGDASVLPTFVCKYFMSPEADEFRKVLKQHFQYVRSEKMKASRSESRKQYWVCIGFRKPL